MDAKRLQHFHGRNSNVRLVIADKGVVPENDIAVAAVVGRGARISGPGYRSFREPLIKSFVRIFRQRSSG